MMRRPPDKYFPRRFVARHHRSCAFQSDLELGLGSHRSDRIWGFFTFEGAFLPGNAVVEGPFPEQVSPSSRQEARYPFIKTFGTCQIVHRDHDFCRIEPSDARECVIYIVPLGFGQFGACRQLMLREIDR